MRRTVYLQLGGYQSYFFHAYEEPDYALQCVAAGWEVLYWPELTVRHHFTPRGRNENQTHWMHARNEFWSICMRCPFPQLLLVALYRLLRQFLYACGRGPLWVAQEPRWWIAAIRGISDALARRDPLPWPIYRRWLRLLRRGASGSKFPRSSRPSRALASAAGPAL